MFNTIVIVNLCVNKSIRYQCKLIRLAVTLYEISMSPSDPTQRTGGVAAMSRQNPFGVIISNQYGPDVATDGACPLQLGAVGTSYSIFHLYG